MIGATRAAMLAATAIRPVLHLRLDEDGGATAADARGLSSSTYHGAIDYGVEPLVADDGNAKGFNGVDTRITIPHVLGLALPAWTVTFLFQLRSAPSAGNHWVFFEKDNNGAGSTSLEVRNAAGILRLRGYAGGAGGPIWIESDAGFGAIELGRAYRFTSTVGSDGARLYLTDDQGATTPLATEAGSVTGWGDNEADITFGAWKIVAGSFIDGFLDDLRIYKRALTEAEIAALPIPVTIAPPVVEEYITTPEVHGWVDGGSVAANTAAFQAAVDDASANATLSATGRGVVELTPGKLYTVTGTKGGNRNPKGCVLINSANVEIRTKGKPTDATRAEVKLANVFTGAPNSIGSLCVFAIRLPAENVRLSHLIVDGNRAQMNVDAVDYNGVGDDGLMHCIHVAGSSGLHLEWVEARNAVVDGLTIDAYLPLQSPMSERPCPETFTAIDCDFHHNRRQALSVVNFGAPAPVGMDWDKGYFLRCKFRNTGDNADNFGQIPGYGVDVEPNAGPVRSWGLTFDGCQFENNGPASMHHKNNIGTNFVRGFGLHTNAWQQSGEKQYYLKIVNCRFSGNRTWDDGDLTIILNQNSARTPGRSEMHHVRFENNDVEKDIYIEGFRSELEHRASTVHDVIIRNNIVKRITFRTFKTTGNSIHQSKNRTAQGAVTAVVVNGIAAISGE